MPTIYLLKGATLVLTQIAVLLTNASGGQCCTASQSLQRGNRLNPTKGDAALHPQPEIVRCDHYQR